MEQVNEQVNEHTTEPKEARAAEPLTSREQKQLQELLAKKKAYDDAERMRVRRAAEKLVQERMLKACGVTLSLAEVFKLAAAQYDYQQKKTARVALKPAEPQGVQGGTPAT